MIQQINFSKIQTISPLSGGSGLVYKNDVLYIVSDDSDILYAYDLRKNHLNKISLRKSGAVQEVIEKSEKSDFEAIGFTKDHYYILGSGSAENRFEMAVLDSDFNFQKRISIEALYRKMMETSEVKEEDFNIEGVVLKDSTACFFNRGNGPNQKNGIFIVENWLGEDFKPVDFIPIELPEVQGFPYTFSDAVLIDKFICFLATNEKTTSVYDDGEILGSAFGILDRESFELIDFQILTTDYKLEGIALCHQDENSVKFYLCDDADDGVTETHLFELEVVWREELV